MLNILVAPNSFKECADSVIISDLIADYLDHSLSRTEIPFKITKIPISDGGDGFLPVCVNKFNLRRIDYTIPPPYKGKDIECRVGYSSEANILFIESAEILGLKLIPPDERKLMRLSSGGLGVLLRKIKDDCSVGRLKLDKIIIGIGGTGTNDLGIGMAGEAGLTLLNRNREKLEPLPEYFLEADSVIFKPFYLPFDIEVISDVSNPLLGEFGSARTYAAQKGADADEIELLERSFEHILKLLKTRISHEELSGAGGGLAAGLQIFFDAKLRSSRDFIINDLGINSKNSKFDIVITGEGKFDRQSFREKGTFVIMNEFRESGAMIYLVCGVSDIDEEIKFYETIELQEFFADRRESISNFKRGIKTACDTIIKKILN